MRRKRAGIVEKSVGDLPNTPRVPTISECYVPLWALNPQLMDANFKPEGIFQPQRGKDHIHAAVPGAGRGNRFRQGRIAEEPRMISSSTMPMKLTG